MMSKITFELTPAEIEAASKGIWTILNPNAHKQHITGYVKIAIFVLLVFLCAYSDNSPILHEWHYLVLNLVLYSILVVLMCFHNYKRYHPNIKRRTKQHHGDQCTIAADSDFLYISSTLGDGSIPWGALSGIAEDDQFLYILINDYSIFVPKRVFLGGIAAGQLYEFIKLHGKQLPVESPWYDKRANIIRWLVLLFPIKLYGLWKSRVFTYKTKIIITASIGCIILC